MRQAEKLYDSITNVREEYLEEARKPEYAEITKDVGRIEDSGAKEPVRKLPAGRKRRRLAWCIPAACLCAAVGIGIGMRQKWDDLGGGGQDGGLWGDRGNSDGFWGDGDCTLLEARREDFTPGLTPEAEAAFADPAFADAPGVMKIYRTLYNEWFLADDIKDFSQVLIADPLYIVHGAVNYKMSGSDRETGEAAYGVYTLDEAGRARWGMGTSGPGWTNKEVPYGLCRLTCEIIEKDLEGVDYEDYIITKSEPLYTVIVWARCAGGEDMFVTYPTCPEFIGVENHGLYTLEELTGAIREAYLVH